MTVLDVLWVAREPGAPYKCMNVLNDFFLGSDRSPVRPTPRIKVERKNMTSALMTPPPSRNRPTGDRACQPRGHRRSAPDSRHRSAIRLLQMEIDFIPNRAFNAEGAEEAIPPEDRSIGIETSRDARAPRDLPGHLARLCETRLLSAEEETRLFRRMNFVKFKAHSIRCELDAEQPDAEMVERAEQYLREAEAIRDRIVKANMRLVMSIVKKFVTPQHSFDDMLSDGIYSLIQAADKFDYDRGFRFSTYAYRAIARKSYRNISDRHKENARFAANSDEVVAETVDDRGSSSIADEAWDRLRGLLAQMLPRLDRREQFIIRSRYALGAHRKVRTFQFLADKLGVSKERARQLEQRAVAKLKSLAAEQPIEELVGVALP